jgi:hypothetical protein
MDEINLSIEKIIQIWRLLGTSEERLSLEEIVQRWRSVGLELLAVEGKLGYWHLSEQHPSDPGAPLEAELKEDEIVAIHRAKSTLGRHVLG